MVAGKINVSAAVGRETALPKSCTSIYINLVGFFAFLFALYLLRQFPQLDVNIRVLVCLLSYAIPIIYLESFVLKVYGRASTGLDYTQANNMAILRIATKLFALFFTYLIISLVYWLLPIYSTEFYQPVWNFLQLVMPWFLMLCIPYVIWVDRYQADPYDIYWQLGRRLIGNSDELQISALKQFVLGWLVKAFFFPLMMAYFFGGVQYLVTVDYNFVISNFDNTYKYFWEFLFTVDLLIACVGYVLTLRLLDSHIRSTEPTLFGWLIALICYEPFWTVIYGSYVAYNVDNILWSNWLADEPKIAFVWGCAILLLLSIYVFSTLAFGIRFSNLTHRGILSNGAYSICKHPAYVAKNTLWWLVSVPFITNLSSRIAVANCLLLLLVNLIYFLRAKTEERHLSQDPAYVEYALAMNQRSIFRFLNPIPFFRYYAPEKTA